MIPLGFSTGCLCKNFDPASPEAITMIKQSGARAIEISVLLADRLPSLERLTLRDLEGFDYVGLHAPADVRYADDHATREVLEALLRFSSRMPVQHVAFHPDTIENWGAIDTSGLPAAFENMDRFKQFGGTLEDMDKVLAGERKMILDVAHAYTHDPTMGLATSLVGAFQESMVGVHVSGCQKHDEDNQHHYPAHMTGQKELFISIPALPVIIESVWPQADSRDALLAGLRQELEYVKGQWEF